MEPSPQESATTIEPERRKPHWQEDLFLDLLRANLLNNLRHLTLRGLQIDVERAAEIAAFCPLLRSLAIHYKPGFSTEAAGVLVSKPIPLERLTLVSFSGSRSKDQAVSSLRELRAAFPLLEISLDHGF